MKILYLIRHAKSSWDDPLRDDIDRPLNRRGQRDAPYMGERLTERSLSIKLMLTSPAQRAMSTCVLMADAMGLAPSAIQVNPRLYHAGVDQLMNVVRGMSEELDSVAVFGHNPGLTDFANQLTVIPVTDNIPTCGVVSLRLSAKYWKDVAWKTAELVFFDYPKKKLD